MVTIKQINSAIAAQGGAEKLAKGNGYFYFYDGDAIDWRESSVYVYRLNQLSLDEWLAEWQRLKNNR